MRVSRRQFVKAVAVGSMYRNGRAATATKHLVAYSIGAAFNVVKNAQEAHRDFRTIEPATYFLGGINQPLAFICGDDSSDWVLIGERDPKSPAITLDDLVVAIRSRFLHGPKDPGVTIDPRGDAEGATVQDVKFFGGVENTAFGQTCFDADWLMKRIGMKLEEVPVDGLRTYFDLASDEARTSGNTQVLSRFWFIPALNNVKVVKGVVYLDQFRPGISTEVLFARVGGETVENLAAFYHRPSAEFARSFEEHYDQISAERPVFARLASLAKLAGLAAGLRIAPATPSLPYWKFTYPVPSVTTPIEIGVLEHKNVQMRFRVAGGVTMASITADLGQGSATAFRELVQAARPGSQAIWEFNMEFTGSAPKGVSFPQGSMDATAIENLWGQALFLMEQRRYEGAIALLNNIIDEVPTLQDPYNLRGLARSANGSRDQALEDFDRALRINPEYAEAHFNRGDTNFALLRYSDAASDYSRAININPTMVEAYLNRGLVFAAQGNQSAALSDYNEALSLNARFAPAFFARGMTETQGGDFESGLRDFDTALKYDSHFAKAYVEKGSILEAFGETDAAVQCYRRFLMYDLPDEDQRRYSKLIVRSRAEELMKDIAIGPDYEITHHGVPLLARAERLKKLQRVRKSLGIRASNVDPGAIK